MDDGIVKIEYCHSRKRGIYAEIELSGNSREAIKDLAYKTNLPYASNEVIES